jgi:hypothetical protein
VSAVVSLVLIRLLVVASSCTENGAAEDDGTGVPAFAEYSLDELRAATDGFSPDRIVSEHGEKAPNVVYRGTLFSSGCTVAIKRFGRSAWPDSRQFVVRVACFLSWVMDRSSFVYRLASDRMGMLVDAGGGAGCWAVEEWPSGQPDWMLLRERRASACGRVHAARDLG